MFGTPKPTFGQTTGTFGAFNSTNAASPFGQNAFGKPATTGFSSTPAFGAAPAGGSLFGTPAPAAGGLFGQPAAQTGFGFQQNASGGLFGAQPANTSLFGQNAPATQTFGTKPGFGTFGTPSTAPVGGMFGSTPQMGTGLFGQPSAATTGTTGLFGSAPGFGATNQTGTYIKYAPVTGTDIIVKNGQAQNINTQHHCITVMKEYENKSLEELRYEDYLANRKGPSNNTMFGSAPGTVANTFGQPGTSGSLFGSNAQDKPGGNLFGQNTSTFGQSSIFGKPATSAFGAQPATSNTFAFGANTANQAGSVFGANKPFGAASAPVFSAPNQTNAFRPTQPSGFPSFGNMQQTSNIFGAKPAENNAFGMPQTSTAGAFGSFGTTQTQNPGDMFGAKTATPFGAAAPVFGTGAPFGASATTGTNPGGLFSSFGAKPAETGVPTFGGFNSTPGTNTGIGGGLNLGGGSLFTAKPAGGSLFGAPTGGTQPGGLFGNTGTNQLGTGLGTLGGGSMLGGTGGLGGFGTGGLGTTGNWGGTNLGNNLNLGGGLGLNTSTGLPGMGTNVTSSGVHDLMMTLTRASPYGDSPLLKGISPSTEKVDDILKPTNPAAQRAIMESDKYKVTPGVTRLKVKPLHAMSKKSLFDGLEEDDPSIQKFTLKPNIKRLVLRPKPAGNESLNGPEITSPNGDAEYASNRFLDAENGRNHFEADSTGHLGDSLVPESNDNEIGSYRKSSPAGIIQKRVGLDSPRGRLLRNSQNNSDIDNADTSYTERSTSHRIIGANKGNEPTALDASTEEILNPRTSIGGLQGNKKPYDSLYPDLSLLAESTSRLVQTENTTGLLDMEDKENIENPTPNDDEDDFTTENQNYSPHPTGIKLTRPGYYTLPSLDDLKGYISTDGKCIVPRFTIGRRNYGNVFFDCEMDVANLDIDELVHIMNKEIVIYPDDDAKPPIGEGLNRPAQVTLDRVYPIDKTLKVPITQPEKLAKLDYEGKLRKVCNKHGTRFIEYRPQTGSWVFKVPHFSKYALTNSDEEDEGNGDAATQPKVPPTLPPKLPPTTLQRGLGGFLPGAFSTGIQSGLSQFIDHNDQTLDSVSADTPFVSRLSGVTRGLAMDTSEENSMDSTGLYTDVGQTSVYGAKDAMSPTSQLARYENRNSHTLQLMKASFFNMEEDMNDAASATDQMVPQLSIANTAPSVITDVPSIASVQTKAFVAPYTGLSIKQPIIKPKSVVLHFHRKVLPLEKTIAGRYGMDCNADLSCAMSRYMRVGWGPSLNLTTLATAESINDKMHGGDLLSLNLFVQGRKVKDTSRQLTLQLHLAGGGPPNNDGKFKTSIENLLKICLEHSEIKTTGDSDSCPLIIPSKDQLSAANMYFEEASRLEQILESTNFGVNPSYWKEVWSLCLALWGKYGDVDSDPNIPSGKRLLGQHAALSDWLQKVAISHTQESTVYSLLASRRIYEACKLAQKQGDYFMAILLSQIAGDMRVRNLAARQLGLWKETCADQYIDPVKLTMYGLIAGYSRIIVSGKPNEGPSTLHVCNGLDWIRAFALHFWYICEPVASLGDAIRAYEHSFSEESRLRKCNNIEDMDSLYDDPARMENGDDFDLTTVETQDILHGRVAFPSPPYETNIEVHDQKQFTKNTLDLRYQLMALRASRWHSIDSILNPASHTPDPLDYRLSWLIQQFLEGIGYSHWSERGLYNIVTGFATQLECHGLWYWAVFVLQHIKDEPIRNRLVKEMIMRYAGGHKEKSVEELLQKLNIPQKWIYQSMALKAKYERDPETEAYYLTLAGQYNEAHKIIVDQLAPTYILNEKPATLRKILKPLISTGDAGFITNWSTGGHLLLEFLDICDEVDLLQEQDADNVSYHCEALRMRLADACNAVTLFPTPTIKHTVARCEIGARLASIGCAIAGIGSTLNKANILPLLNLLNRLDLPSDYIRKLLDKVSDCFMDDPDPVSYSETMSNSSDETE